MSRRRDLPGLDVEAVTTLNQLREHLRMWRCETLEAVDLLHAHLEKVDAAAARLENPNAVVEYLNAFVEFFGRISTELAEIDTSLEEGVTPEAPAALRQIASNAAIEQRRCLGFRDKCINKPLPHEDMRPLLNQISIDTRDQLLDYQDLALAAARLDAMISVPPVPPAADQRSFNRRALFTRFLPKKNRSL